MEDNRRKLYDAVSKDFGDVGTFSDFSQKLDDPTSRRKLYDAMASEYGDIGSYEDFSGKIDYKDFSNVTGGAITQQYPQALDQALGRGKEVMNAFSQPGETINKAFGQVSNGNYIAGGANALNAVAQIPGAALNAVNQMYPFQWQRDAGNFLINDVAGAIPKVAGAAVNLGTNAIGSVLPPSGIQMNPQNAQEATSAMNELNTNLATGLVGNAVPRIAGRVAPYAEQAIASAEQASAARSMAKGEREFMKAAPPTKNQLNFKQQLRRAEPYIAEQARRNPIDSGLEDSPYRQTLGLLTRAKHNLWDKSISPIISRHPNVRFDASSVGETVRSSLNDYTLQHEPAKVKAIQTYADSWNGEMTLREAQGQLSAINAETAKFNKMSPVEQAAVEAQNGPMAIREAAGDALRQMIADRLESLGERGMRELKMDYGSLKTMEDAVRRNVVKAEKEPNKTSVLSRHGRPLWMGVITEALGNAIGVPPTVGLGLGVGAGVVADKLATRQSPQSLIERSVGRFAKNAQPPKSYQYLPPDVAGLLPKGTFKMGGGAQPEGSFNVNTGIYQPDFRTPPPRISPPLRSGVMTPEGVRIADMGEPKPAMVVTQGPPWDLKTSKGKKAKGKKK